MGTDQRLQRIELPDPATARSVREDFGWSRRQMAAELGVSESSIVRWERGTATPTPGRLREWVALLDRMTVEIDG